jgi:ubiquinone/menaquinone biosynthesis C-methylase UbiE
MITTEFYNVKKHWNNVGGENYQHFWNSSLAHKELSKKEEEHVKKFIPQKTIKVLDYGTGSGRFLNVLLKNTSPESEIYALDISEVMVKHCQEKFGMNRKVKGIKTIVENSENIDDHYKTKFDFITAVRVLKYNSNWRKILTNLFKILENNGTIIFTMPKKYLIIRLSKPKSPYRTTIEEIKNFARQNNMEIIDVRGFAKIPDFFYRVNNKLFSKIVLFCESILKSMFGQRLFEREVFYVFRK